MSETEERFLRIPEVLDRIGVQRTKLHMMIKHGEFPAPIKIGSSSVWPNSVITKWQKEVMASNGLGQ